MPFRCVVVLRGQLLGPIREALDLLAKESSATAPVPVARPMPPIAGPKRLNVRPLEMRHEGGGGGSRDSGVVG
jgi:hypothetical protein